MNKKVLLISDKTPQHWVGDAFQVRTMFSYGSPGLGSAISPFLLLDYGDPREVKPSPEQGGVGEHPHRGFETVTIAYQGEVDHRDSAGHSGRIGPGDVQWMTAASGVVHEEKLSPDFMKRGGTIEMAQLWVNLPAKYKMSAPKYQSISRDQIPTVALPNDAGSLRVIAGDYTNTQGPAQTFTPLNVWDVKLNANSKLDLPLPDNRTSLLAILRGSITVNDASKASGGQVVLLAAEGDGAMIQAESDAVFLVLNGEHIPEQIAGYGPFVMNTREEIHQAIEDYQNGLMGHVE
ncbi:MAG: pirin family protein [Candidatus Kapaibacterium sp.]|jgi:redox-sensitive bicupin YhaK (pirin superfamily)